MPLFDHFNLVAPFYDRAIPLQQAHRIIELLGLSDESVILDAGGGTGRVANALKPYASQIVVADLAFGMLQQAKLKAGLWITQSHTEWLPFPGACFDRILMVDALHHVCDHQETANELWRVLKPGGRIVIEEPDVRTFPVKLVALAEKLALMRSHFISPPGIAALFSDPSASSAIQTESWNAWVLIDKPVH